jgi:hypothetical protein
VANARDLQLSHSDSFDWVFQVVMRMIVNNVASATLEGYQLVLHLRNVTRKWTNGPQVSAPQAHELPNDLSLGSAESMRIQTNQRNGRPLRESTL